jgi:hypothetical protein
MALFPHIAREVQIVLDDTPRIVMEDRRSAIRRGIKAGAAAGRSEVLKLAMEGVISSEAADIMYERLLEPLSYGVLLSVLTLPPHLGFPGERAVDVVGARGFNSSRRVELRRGLRRRPRARPD